MKALCVGGGRSVLLRVLGERGIAAARADTLADALAALLAGSFELVIIAAAGAGEAERAHEALSTHPGAKDAAFVVLAHSEADDAPLVRLRVSMAERDMARAADRDRLE